MLRAPRLVAAFAASWGFLSAVLVGGCASPPAQAPFTLWYSVADTRDVARVDPLLEQGLPFVAQATGLRWRLPLRVAIVDDRPAFSAALPAELGLAQTPCWMVAWSAADRLVLLSPRAWPPQACDVDAEDTRALALLLRHELVHVLADQHNPTGDCSRLVGLDWFVEGLAVFASGQLERQFDGDAQRALLAGTAPQHLADAWTGDYRQGVCGSLVAYLDQRCGRDRLAEMVGATTQPQLLEIAGLSEDELLANWVIWVSR